MHLVQVYVRHYKSFNYDYERKAKPKATEFPWEAEDDGWFPFVAVQIEPDVTAVVGANESGKSHLLDAVEILLTGRNQRKRDFCRYSTLFSVEQGQRRFPDFAGLFDPTDEDRQKLIDAAVPLQSNGRVLLWRSKPDELKAVDETGSATVLDPAAVEVVTDLLPIPFRLETNIPLPDSVSIKRLAGSTNQVSRRRRNTLLQLITGVTTADALQAVSAPVLSELLSPDTASRTSGSSHSTAQQELGVLLLTKVARIETSTFVELEEAIKNEHEGHVSGLIQKMNESLARHLNLPRWWRQDPDFTLRVSPREHELVFTIRDRTGTDYSFNERSMGLRYFLSYFVQLRAHDRAGERQEILLMDEPDTYLSAAGQQDLLRVLENYVRPDGKPSSDQVMYVTHSPFLINRNAGHRIRVLDKGTAEEGTRVVKDATRNRYEPLRSSIGAFVAETAFVGGANLFVEGPSDQIYLAEMSNYLRSRGYADSVVLDLNEITIVASGSASSIAYMLYLARGQDEIKPPCAVLLDSDKSGQEARQQINRGGVHKKPLVPAEYVTMIGDWAEGAGVKIAPGVAVRDIEDLLPLRVAVAAARAYASHFLGLPEAEVAGLTESEVVGLIESTEGSLLDAVQLAFSNTFSTSLEKVGFAKEVVRLINDTSGGRRHDGVPDLETNFGLLISHLADLLRRVVNEEEAKRRDKRLGRIIKSFVRDYPDVATRDRANIALKEVEAASGESLRAEEIRAVVAGIRREFRLTTDPLAAVENYGEFKLRFSNVVYVERLANQGSL